MGMRRTLVVALVSLLFPLFWIPGHAPAATPKPEDAPRVLSDCSMEQVVPCIESIRVRTKSGRIIPTSLTGRSTDVDTEFVGMGYPEYEVRGLTFEGTSRNLFIPRIVYYRYPPPADCEKTATCENERDFLATGVQPSWLNRASLNPLENEIPLSNRPSNLLCGTPERREKCYRSNNFDVEIDFLLNLKMPKSFSPMWASGSAKNLAITNWRAAEDANGDSYTLEISIGTLEREMVLFSDYYKNPIDAIEGSPYADFKADWPGIWIHSSRDRSVNPLGQCRDKPFMSVSTNGIYQEVPLWNPSTETIDLKLYAPHLKVEGGLNRGFYQLRISEELAKCFWKIDVSERTQARVIISYPDSTSDVVIETTKIAFKSGILEVLATNFTFSSPTIRARVFKAEVTPAKSDAARVPLEPKGTNAETKKMKKTCVNGSKKVRVESQRRCPSGFKPR
jgi:hypothetical protein